MLKPLDSVAVLVCLANGYAKNDERAAEKFFRQALFLAEHSYGKDSPQAGMVLLSLTDLFDSQKRLEESNEAQLRIRSILIKNAHLCDKQADDLV